MSYFVKDLEETVGQWSISETLESKGLQDRERLIEFIQG